MQESNDWVTYGVDEGYLPCRMHMEIYGCKQEQGLFIATIINAAANSIGLLFSCITIFRRLRRSESRWKMTEICALHLANYHFFRLLFGILLLVKVLPSNTFAIGGLMFSTGYAALFAGGVHVAISLVQVYPISLQTGFRINVGAKALHIIKIVSCVMGVIVLCGTALGAGLARQHEHFSLEITLMRAFYVVQSLADLANGVIIEIFGRNLQKLSRQHIRVISQFGNRSHSSSRRRIRRKSSITLLRLTSSRIKWIRRLGLLIAIFEFTIMLSRGIFFPTIANSGTLSLLFNALNDQVLAIIFCCVSIVLMRSFFSQWDYEDTERRQLQAQSAHTEAQGHITGHYSMPELSQDLELSEFEPSDWQEYQNPMVYTSSIALEDIKTSREILNPPS